MFNHSLPDGYLGGANGTQVPLRSYSLSPKGNDQNGQSITFAPDESTGAITLYYGMIDTDITGGSQAVTFTNLTSTLVRADGSGWQDVSVGVVGGSSLVLNSAHPDGYIYSSIWANGYNSIILNIGDVLTFNFGFTETVNGNKTITFYGYQAEQGAAATPEPATMLIFGIGTLAAGVCVRRKRK